MATLLDKIEPIVEARGADRLMLAPSCSLLHVLRWSFVRDDQPREQTCSCEREQDSSVGQALHLNNGSTLNDKLRAKGSVLEKWAAEKVGDDEAVRRVFLRALCREPTAAERTKFEGLLAEAGRDPKTTRREALEDLFWAVLSSREFLFNH